MFFAGLVGVFLLIAEPFLDGGPLLVLNGSASAPLGLYRMLDRGIRRGDLVLVRPPKCIANLIAERGYLPPSVPLIKRVVGLPGDKVCRETATVSVNGKLAAIALRMDGEGRWMPVWSGCRRLREGEIFLLQEHPRSLDGRYFGPIGDVDVIGILRPLWLFGPSETLTDGMVGRCQKESPLSPEAVSGSRFRSSSGPVPCGIASTAPRLRDRLSACNGG